MCIDCNTEGQRTGRAVSAACTMPNTSDTILSTPHDRTTTATTMATGTPPPQQQGLSTPDSVVSRGSVGAGGRPTRRRATLGSVLRQNSQFLPTDGSTSAQSPLDLDSPGLSEGAFSLLDDSVFEEYLDRSPECFAVVKWDYLAVNEDELTLRKGESVAVYCRDEAIIGDVGWWFGKVNSRAGMFPLNYVKAVEVPTSPEPSNRSNLFEIQPEEITKHKLLATGGFGRVYLGSYGMRVVAVKELITTAVPDENLKRKFDELRREGELLAQFSHRNIATLHGAVTSPGSVALVMEYAAGGRMNYLHNESPVSVVHRDLKSANVLLSNAASDDNGGKVQTIGNTLKITDFGLARTFANTGNQSGSLGTCQWMAPETIRTGTYSKASDVWSFGVVLWELLTSQVPYRGLPWGTILYSIGVGGSALPIPSSCPEPFRDLLAKCAEKEPTQRPLFGRIVAILTHDTHLGDGGDTTRQSAAGAGEAWTALQVHWKSEMEQRFQSLKQSEKVMESQQVELRALQQRQTQRQQALNAKEHDLIQKSRELQYRELKLLVDAGKESLPPRPAPVRRRGAGSGHRQILMRGRSSQRLSKEDIGTPREFRHLVHLTNDGGLTQMKRPTTASQSPVAGSARALWTDGDDSGGSSNTVQCRSCFHLNPLAAIHGSWQCVVCRESLVQDSASSSVVTSPTSPLAGGGGVGGVGVGGVRSAYPGPDTPMHAWHDAAPHMLAKSASVSGAGRDTSRRRRTMLGGICRRGSTSPPVPPRPARCASFDSNEHHGPFNEGTDDAPLLEDHSYDTMESHSHRHPHPPPPPTDSIDTFDDTRIDDTARLIHAPGCGATPCGTTEARRPAMSVQRRTASDTGGRMRESLPSNTVDPTTVPSTDDKVDTLTTPYEPEFTSPWGDSHCSEWFKPGMTRTEAKAYITDKPVGTFVVRRSASQPGSLAIAVLQRHGVIWVGVMIPSDGGWRLGKSGPILFRNPTELVKYYCNVPYARDTEGNNCTLRLPGEANDSGRLARQRAMSESLIKINPLRQASRKQT
eukprot:m.93561 g.93561  ORF g.93561 m.93561 type:complete len:1035 (-) comp10008_c0_seq1:82-3186(-)